MTSQSLILMKIPRCHDGMAEAILIQNQMKSQIQTRIQSQMMIQRTQ